MRDVKSEFSRPGIVTIRYRQAYVPQHTEYGALTYQTSEFTSVVKDGIPSRVLEFPTFLHLRSTFPRTSAIATQDVNGLEHDHVRRFNAPFSLSDMSFIEELRRRQWCNMSGI